MKTIIYILPILAIALFSFTYPEVDESIYSNSLIKYSVERDGASAVIKLDITNIEEYDEIHLSRSGDASKNFRRVKFFDTNQLSDLSETGMIVDKYPLPSSVDSFYKIIAVKKGGLYRLFPSVKLSKY